MQPKLDLHLAKSRKPETLQGIHSPATTNPFIFKALTLKMDVAGTTRSGICALPATLPRLGQTDSQANSSSIRSRRGMAFRPKQFAPLGRM
jgi:hypothetical protein